MSLDIDATRYVASLYDTANTPDTLRMYTAYFASLCRGALDYTGLKDCEIIRVLCYTPGGVWLTYKVNYGQRDVDMHMLVQLQEILAERGMLDGKTYTKGYQAGHQAAMSAAETRLTISERYTYQYYAALVTLAKEENRFEEFPDYPSAWEGKYSCVWCRAYAKDPADLRKVHKVFCPTGLARAALVAHPTKPQDPDTRKLISHLERIIASADHVDGKSSEAIKPKLQRLLESYRSGAL